MPLSGFRVAATALAFLLLLAQPVAAEDIYGLGTVEARVLSRVGFDLAGTVVELNADHGELVKRGQVMARLDSREQTARVAQDEAGLRQAAAALNQAQARLERARAQQSHRRNVNQRRQSLVRNGTVSVEAAEDAQSTAEMAAADVAVAQADVEAARGAIEAAQATLRLSRTTLDRHQLVAPYDAIVIERSRELGAALTAGTPLFTIVDPGTVWVQAFVDESRAGPLKVGQKATITLRSLPGRVHAGTVVRIGIESDRVSEERRVHVAFDSPLADFHLGEQAEILVSTDGATP